MRRGIAVVCVALLGVGVGAALTVDRWLFELLDPGPFDPSRTPPPPDYASDAAWAALPTLDDDADVSLPALPAIDPREAPADVFYVHPTTWVGAEWNGPTDDPAVVKATARGGTLIQASAFNACCAVYAPRYRQANGRAFVTPSADGDRAIDVAYGDVVRAFGVFLRRTGGRPFVLAAHSQGSVLASRLLREEIWPKRAGRRLVVAYLVGGPVTHANLGGDVPTCRSASDTGCVAAWNARGPRFRPHALEFPVPMADRVCVSPLTWTTAGSASPAANAGALFFDAETPRVLPAFADGRCEHGTLLVTRIGKPPRDAMSRILDWIIGPQNYHPIEYQLYYVNLRRNAVERVERFLQEASHV